MGHATTMIARREERGELLSPEGSVLGRLLSLTGDRGTVSYEDVDRQLDGHRDDPAFVEALLAHLAREGIELVDVRSTLIRAPLPGEPTRPVSAPKPSVDKDPLSAYLGTLRNIPLLTREGEVELCWQVEDGEGLRALAQSRVVARDGIRAVVEQNGGQRLVYQVRPGGIFRPDLGVWLLKAPLRAGASWPSASGRTARIVATDAAVEVPAGRFTGCLRVEEAGGRDGRRIVTVYCPDVGPVLVETSIGLPAAGRQVRVTARLLGHAVDTGDGQ